MSYVDSLLYWIRRPHMSKEKEVELALAKEALEKSINDLASSKKRLENSLLKSDVDRHQVVRTFAPSRKEPRRSPLWQNTH